MNKDRVEGLKRTRLRILCNKMVEAALEDEGQNSRLQRQDRYQL